MIEIMYELRNECNESGENHITEENYKKLKVCKTKIIQTLSELENKVEETKKAFLEATQPNVNSTPRLNVLNFGMSVNTASFNNDIEIRISQLDYIQMLIKAMRGIISEIIANGQNFKCKDCKKLLELEDICYSLETKIIHLDVSPTGIEQGIWGILSQISHLNISETVKDVLINKGHFKKISNAYVKVLEQLTYLQKMIVKEQFCKSMSEHKKTELLQHFKNLSY